MLNKSFNTIDIYKKALDASWLRNQAISNNISNVNTPGYKRQDVNFESILKGYLENNHIPLKKTHPKHFSNNLEGIKPKIIKESNTSFRRDKNNVNIDVEMAELAKNTMKFNSLAQQLSGSFRRLKMSITDGRK